MKGETILYVEEVTSSPFFDDLGEIDFGVRVEAFAQYLHRKGDPAKRRAALATELRSLADKCEAAQYPFSSVGEETRHD